MRSIVFDAGPIISLTTNNLLGLLKTFKQKYKGQFFISEAVKKELIDKPLASKKYKFEALQVLRALENKVIDVFFDSRVKELTDRILTLSNQSFSAYGHWINIIHFAEAESLATALHLNSDALVVDERTIRLLVENPKACLEVLKKTLHTNIEVNEENIFRLQELTKRIKVIRSVELVVIAFEIGLLDKYILHIPNAKRTLLESILWGVKLNGCAVTKREIEQIIKLEAQ